MKDAKAKLTFRRETKKKYLKGRNHERGRDKEPGQGNSSPSERPPGQACNGRMVSMTKGQHVVLLALQLLLPAPVSPSLSLSHTCPSPNSFLLQHLYKQVVLALSHKLSYKLSSFEQSSWASIQTSSAGISAGKLGGEFDGGHEQRDELSLSCRSLSAGIPQVFNVLTNVSITQA